MAAPRICVKCEKPVIKNQPAFKQDDGTVIHGACYNCDQCGANMVGKKVGSVPKDDTSNEYIKVCWECMMKHPHYSILFSGQSGDAAPVKQAVNKIDVCKQCQQKIIGKSYQTKSGDHYHEQCYCCQRCNTPLAGKKYGMLDDQRWCQDCINQRSASKGDIVTKSGPKSSAAQAYTATMTKLKTQDIKAMRNSSLGKERKCAKCGGKIAGPSVTVDRENSKYEYHRDCIFCDDCNNKLNTFTMKIFKDKALCPNCIKKYLDFNHGKKIAK
eukprot:CAMPEP_0202689654 /NCGR_PEP_ID=MMETSP1385-20130828/4862_1 /ASSEMBLY_ACC=CAM_ASM_000861 /TAXON_ID=933848 /ORGANISM="Elphidium margaritaceum" /LENGTH=269 /DNA_ID=CAMNT_0049344809 /DNA_START=13 /DNA_END=822 /DNA_ORIENTATION=+